MCVNGNESMDSLDSQSLLSSSEAGGNSRTALDNGPAKPETQEDEEEQKEGTQDEHGLSTQEQPLQEDRPAPESVEEDTSKEGCSKAEKCETSQSEQPKGLEEVIEEVPAPPPVIVDHQRLLVLLDLVVKKSQGFSVEQLERLYSVLSQCIYLHRQAYDKTPLLQDMEHRIQTFDTFL